MARVGKRAGLAGLLLLAFCGLCAAGGLSPTNSTMTPGYFNPAYNYTQSDIVTEFEVELNNPYVSKIGANSIGTNTYQAILTLPACTYITPHFHPQADEFNYLLVGSLQYTISKGDGSLLSGTIPTGSLGIMPQGLTHLLLNNGCGPATMYHFFPIVNPLFTPIITELYQMPQSFIKDAFGVDVMPAVHAPDNIHVIDLNCVQACGIDIATFYKYPLLSAPPPATPTPNQYGSPSPSQYASPYPSYTMTSPPPTPHGY